MDEGSFSPDYSGRIHIPRFVIAEDKRIFANRRVLGSGSIIYAEGSELNRAIHNFAIRHKDDNTGSSVFDLVYQHIDELITHYVRTIKSPVPLTELGISDAFQHFQIRTQ